MASSDPDLIDDRREDPAGVGAEAARHESHDEDDRLIPRFVDDVGDALDDGRRQDVFALVEPLHPADLADLFELLSPERRLALAATIPELIGSDVVAELNDHVREELIEALSPDAVAQIAEQLDTDDAVAMIEDLGLAEQRAILAELDAEDRAAIESALNYPEETAGRLMQRDLVAVPQHITVGDLIDYLRDNPDLTTEFWEVFVVDPAHRPVGTCQLSWVLRTPRTIAITDVMKREQTLIPVTMDQEEVARRFQKYALISAAVVDGSGRLVGQITADDVAHVIEEEASEDALLMSGAGEGDINEPIREAYAQRVRWLIANLGTALIASLIIAMFGAAIEKLVALAVLMPIVASIGGNAGTQTMAVSVRALATNQLTRSNTRRVIVREMRVALLNGGTVALLIGAATAAIFTPLLGAVIALAVIINIITAGLAGVAVPVMFDRVGQDPAVASSVFVTMITDSMGFFAFLGLAVASGTVG